MAEGPGVQPLSASLSVEVVSMGEYGFAGAAEPLYRRILVPTDGHALSDEAVAHGVRLAARTGAEICFLTVTEPFHLLSLEAEQLEDTPETYRRHAQERAQRVLSSAAEAATAAGVPFETVHEQDDEPHRAIIRTAAVKDCDLVVMASHGRRGVSALVLGSETQKVLTHCAVPVLVCRPKAAKPASGG